MTKKRWSSLITALCFILLFSGCLYAPPKSESTTVESGADLLTVQQAVDAFITDNGTPPVLRANPYMEKMFYQLLDLPRLKPRYLPQFPENSFDNGGTSIYVLINLDSKPAVRMIDLRFQNQLTEMEQIVRDYMAEHNRVPRGMNIGNGLYLLDTSVLNAPKTTIRSMFSTNELKFLVDEKGGLSVDYLPDIASFLQLNPNDRKANTDLSDVLPRHSFFAPLAANRYILKNELIEMLPR